jgi:hypothetical protein
LSWRTFSIAMSKDLGTSRKNYGARTCAGYVVD